MRIWNQPQDFDFPWMESLIFVSLSLGSGIAAFWNFKQGKGILSIETISLRLFGGR